MVQTFAKPRHYAIIGIVLIIAIFAVGAEQQAGLGGSQYNSSLPSCVAIAARLATVIIAPGGLVAYE